MIKNIENLKKIQIVCRKEKDVENYLNYLKQLGFDVEDFTEYCDGCNIIFWGDSSKKFIISNMLKINLPIEFYSKKFIKTLQKFIKEKEEKIEDIEVASDGRITKINNYKSKKEIIVACDWENIENGIKINDVTQIYLDFCLKYGLAYATPEARDRAEFKLEIETKLKNIAERLNNGRKIDWEDKDQNKYEIYYDYNDKKLDWYIVYCSKNQGVIYCLDENFLNVAKKEIGEDNLIKYFME